MLAAYPAPQTLTRPATRETGDSTPLRIDCDLLRLIADAAHELPIAARVVAPRELDPCGVCDEVPGSDPLPGDAVVSYRIPYETYRYETTVCRDHIGTEYRYRTRRHGSGPVAFTDVRVEIPAPLAGAR